MNDENRRLRAEWVDRPNFLEISYESGRVAISIVKTPKTGKGGTFYDAVFVVPGAGAFQTAVPGEDLDTARTNALAILAGIRPSTEVDDHQDERGGVE